MFNTVIIYNFLEYLDMIKRLSIIEYINIILILTYIIYKKEYQVNIPRESIFLGIFNYLRKNNVKDILSISNIKKNAVLLTIMDMVKE